MEKTTTLNLRINLDVKRKAEKIHAKLKEGYNDIEKGNIQDASATFQNLRKTYPCKIIAE